MSDRKKKIAVIAAVANYIKSEQEAVAFSMSQVAGLAPAIAETKEPAPLVMNLWGISGRQQQMQMRSMMQMKAFHGSKQKF
ncbi:MAG: hypothetical protein HF978_16050 [Desulfobacteraceae bacterium]|nr:hypothetical protein [Desulfobacteraceae bacterium]MBC2757056.1 hypothetical protein [Desulfobacteraceae bacterium]